MEEPFPPANGLKRERERGGRRGFPSPFCTARQHACWREAVETGDVFLVHSEKLQASFARIAPEDGQDTPRVAGNMDGCSVGAHCHSDAAAEPAHNMHLLLDETQEAHRRGRHSDACSGRGAHGSCGVRSGSEACGGRRLRGGRRTHHPRGCPAAVVPRRPRGREGWEQEGQRAQSKAIPFGFLARVGGDCRTI
ncbi:MAG: hypothetical protein KatS3mg077_0096 [Candidatus Binatia bacterium]|nr:MAG: hypothetical protein KatS3mg077_0096 [Candidatus Binatia bacterium]